MEDVAKKIESLSSAVFVGTNMKNQLMRDKETYIQAFEDQQKGIPDERIKALHRIVYNNNMNAYAQHEKELENQIKDYQEQIDNETEKAQNKKQESASSDSKDQ